MLCAFAIFKAHSVVGSRLALQSFSRSHEAASPSSQGSAGSPAPSSIDFSIWSPKRVQAYRESLLTKLDTPTAVLRIPKLGIEVPVFEGTDDLTLNRGVGRILDTPKVGEPGNIGIAGHRDGFFRGLKDIASGDALELVTPDRTIHYSVDQIEIVQPEDVGVLNDRGTPSLTLVTCYPFYFIGDAPQRFIVHAKAADFVPSTNLPGPSSVQLKSKENVN